MLTFDCLDRFPKIPALTLVVALLFLGNYSAFSQDYSERNLETFRIVKGGSSYTAETVIKTFETARMSFHRFQSIPNIIVLDDGTEVEIFPASRLAEKGIITNPGSFAKNYPENYEKSTFRIAKGSILVELRPIAHPEKNTKK